MYVWKDDRGRHKTPMIERRAINGGGRSNRAGRGMRTKGHDREEWADRNAKKQRRRIGAGWEDKAAGTVFD